MVTLGLFPIHSQHIMRLRIILGILIGKLYFKLIRNLIFAHVARQNSFLESIHAVLVVTSILVHAEPSLLLHFVGLRFFDDLELHVFSDR